MITEDLLDNCSTPRNLPFLLSQDGAVIVEVNALTSTQEWVSLTVNVAPNPLKVGWNGKRLSWTENTRKLYVDYGQLHDIIVERLSEMTPTDVLFAALERYHFRHGPKKQKPPEYGRHLDPTDPNTVVNISRLVRNLPLFARARSLQSYAVELVALKPAKTKRFRRVCFYFDGTSPPPEEMWIAPPEDRQALARFMYHTSMTEFRAVTIGAAWMDLRTIADAPKQGTDNGTG